MAQSIIDEILDAENRAADIIDNGKQIADDIIARAQESADKERNKIISEAKKKYDYVVNMTIRESELSKMKTIEKSKKDNADHSRAFEKNRDKAVEAVISYLVDS